ncbi:MAG TPA: hypothetical protein VFE61_32375 [Candidatus Sulfotelmatobacter sp.]|nr:hypothetical protein [Candidatus Sulfotelmatobacter sp.]
MMVAITIILSHLDSVWRVGAGKWDDLPITTAQGLIVLLNGPAAVPRGLKTLAQLPEVPVFWAWFGYLLDRRLRGLQKPVVRNRSVRVVLYCLGFILACLFAWEGISHLRMFDARLIRYVWRALENSSSRRTLLGGLLMPIADSMWGLGYAVYFSVKLWRFATHPSESADIP